MTTKLAKISGLAAAAAMLILAGCTTLDVENLNGVSAEGLQNAPTAQQIYTAAQSLESSWRGVDAAHASTLTKYGFEHWQVRASEPRTLTDIVTSPNTGSFWSFGTIRNIGLLLEALKTVSGPTATEVAGVHGWLRMNLAIQYEDMAQAHDSFGIVLDLPADPEKDIPPIVTSKAAVWGRIFALMDSSYTDFLAAGTTFPFRLHSGFTGFNTPATMARVNRALKARWLTLFAVPLGRTGYNAADWNNVLTAITDAAWLGQTFPASAVGISATFLRAGPKHIYTSDQTNGLSATDRYSNARIRREAQCKAVPGAGTCTGDSLYNQSASTNRDDRAYGPGAKVFILPPASALSFAGVTTNLRHTDFLTPQAATASIGSTSLLPIIRNEELLLLRAEAYMNLGGAANETLAIADLNRIRQSAIVNLPPISDPYVGNAALNQPSTLENELLYEKRFSLWGETGTVWLDMRHYGRAFEIPHYDPAFRIIDIFPFPIAECDIRKYRGEGGPNGCYRGGYPGLQNGPNLLFQPL